MSVILCSFFFVCKKAKNYCWNVQNRRKIRWKPGGGEIGFSVTLLSRPTKNKRTLNQEKLQSEVELCRNRIPATVYAFYFIYVHKWYVYERLCLCLWALQRLYFFSLPLKAILWFKQHLLGGIVYIKGTIPFVYRITLHFFKEAESFHASRCR